MSRAREGALVLVAWEWAVESTSARAVDMRGEKARDGRLSLASDRGTSARGRDGMEGRERVTSGQSRQ